MIEFKRLVVLRKRDEPDRKLVVLRGVNKIQVPHLRVDNMCECVWDVCEYVWDGRSTTVEGLPVFE